MAYKNSTILEHFKNRFCGFGGILSQHYSWHIQYLAANQNAMKFCFSSKTETWQVETSMSATYWITLLSFCYLQPTFYLDRDLQHQSSDWGFWSDKGKYFPFLSSELDWRCTRNWEGNRWGTRPQVTQRIFQTIWLRAQYIKLEEEKGSGGHSEWWCLSYQVTVRHDGTLLSWKWGTTASPWEVVNRFLVLLCLCVVTALSVKRQH